MADPDSRKEWLTIREVATMLSVSQRQVWKWIGCSDFETKRFGKRIIRVSLRSVRQFIDRQPTA